MGDKAIDALTIRDAIEDIRSFAREFGHDVPGAAGRHVAAALRTLDEAPDWLVVLSKREREVNDG